MREKKLEFTKEHTLVAKSIAIILMFIHHLFAFPNRGGIYFTVLPIFEIGGKNIEYHLAIYGKICVAMYLFLSGYGMAIIENRKKITVKDSIARIKKI